MNIKIAFNQGLNYCLYMNNLDRCNVSCNNAGDPSCRISVLNKTGDVYLSIFNMIRRINEPNTLIKRIYHANVNVDLMIENLTLTKRGIK